MEQWRRIVTLPDSRIAGVAALLPLPLQDAPARQLKAYEDALDGVVCAWVGICALDWQSTAGEGHAHLTWRRQFGHLDPQAPTGRDAAAHFQTAFA